MKIAVMGVGCWDGGLFARAGEEVRLIGRARHVEAVVRHGLPMETGAFNVRVPRVMPGQRSSTAQDLPRGRPTEIDYLNGCIVRRGDRLGVPAPAKRLLSTLVKILESRVGFR
jgi:2-dehydropantoate 2-reductase